MRDKCLSSMCILSVGNLLDHTNSLVIKKNAYWVLHNFMRGTPPPHNAYKKKVLPILVKAIAENMEEDVSSNKYCHTFPLSIKGKEKNVAPCFFFLAFNDK